MRLEMWKPWDCWKAILGTVGRSLILRPDGCHCFSSFHIALNARRILKTPKCHHEQFAWIKKFRENIWWLVIWMNWSKFCYYFWNVTYQFQICYTLNSPDNVGIVGKSKTEVPHGEYLKKSLIIEKCEIIFW
jgi:hypothetical protein